MLKHAHDVKSDADTPSGVSAFLAFGGNLGDREAVFRKALISLRGNGFAVDAASGLYESAPVGCEDGAQPFYNAVVRGRWSGTPESLLALCQEIEIASGRPADHPHWHSRTLDLDLILFGERILHTDSLILPHPLAHTRLFVLLPLVEIAPEALFPTLHLKASELLAARKGTEEKMPHRIKLFPL